MHGTYVGPCSAQDTQTAKWRVAKEQAGEQVVVISDYNMKPMQTCQVILVGTKVVVRP